MQNGFFFLEHKRNKLFSKFPNKFYFHWVENNFSMVNQNKVVFCIRIMYFDVSEWKAIDQKPGLTVWTECNTGQQSVTQDNTTKPSLQAGLICSILISTFTSGPASLALPRYESDIWTAPSPIISHHNASVPIGPRNIIFCQVAR